MARAPRRDPRAPSSATSLAAPPSPKPRSPAGTFAKPGRQKHAPTQTQVRPPHPGVPAGTHRVSGGQENNRAFEAMPSAEGSQGPEAQAARTRADEVLGALFGKHGGNGAAADSAGLAVRSNGAQSSNGHPFGEHDRGAAPAYEAESEAEPESAGEVESDAALLLEPIVYPDDPANAGLPSGDSDLEDSLEAYPRNAEALARAALLRSGFEEAEVDAMDPDKLLKRGMSAHRRLAAADDTFRQLSEARKGQVREQPAEPATAGQPAKGSLKERLAPLLEPIGEDGVAAVVAAIEAEVGPLKSAVQTLAGNAVKTRESYIRTLVGESRKGWVERFPQLANGKIAGHVERRMGVLVNDPAFNKPGMSDQDRSDRIMLSAALSLGLDDTRKPRSPASRQETRRKQAGTAPTTKQQSEKGAKPMDAEERQSGILNLLLDGDVMRAREFGLRSAR